MVCTSDLFARREEGKAVGLEIVTTVFDDVSLLCAPQIAHVRTMFCCCFPTEPSNKLPQSVQKTRDPIYFISKCLISDIQVERYSPIADMVGSVLS